MRVWLGLLYISHLLYFAYLAYLAYFAYFTYFAYPLPVILYRLSFTAY